MGYYSDFFLETSPSYIDDKLASDIAKALMKTDASGYFDSIGFTKSFIKGRSSAYGLKWYNCEKDFLEISKQFPDVAFAIKRVGEDGSVEGIYVTNGTSEIQNRPLNREIPRPKSILFRNAFGHP